MSNILKQIRWQQRYIHLEKSYLKLLTFIEKETYSELEQAGVIQFFEITLELSWKTLKDYLEAENIVVTFPRDVIKQAFAHNVITDGKLWLEALETRNILSHTYKEDVAITSFNLIKNKYSILFIQLVQFLKSKLFPAQDYGLSLSNYIILINTFTAYSELKSVKIFGLRAMGNYKPYSDIDLCLYGDITLDLILKVKTQLSELTELPYQFDVVGYNLITENAFKAHIDTVGKIILETP